MGLFKKKASRNGFNTDLPLGCACLVFAIFTIVECHHGNDKLWLSNTTISKEVETNSRTARQLRPPFLNQVCGGTLSVDPKNTSSIVSPVTATTKVQCRWNIQVPFGQQIKFIFEYFRLPASQPDCSDFYFEIKDVTGTQRYCHDGPSGRSYVATGSVLQATYYSLESRQQDDGLRVRLEYGRVPCQAFITNMERGSIFTPGYPSAYPDDQICTWRVQVPVGYLLQFSCDPTTFWIENAPSCQNDVLLLSLTGRVDFADALSFCGRRGPTNLVSSTNVITLIFKSNLYYHYRGFRCAFSAFLSGGVFPTIPPTATPIDPNACGSCGIGNQASVRVTGGTESAKNQFPWTVAILRREGNQTGLRQFCGGTLLNDRYVLTAAHCVNTRTADVLRVDVGEHDLSTGTESPNRIVNVASILVNPGYLSNPSNNVDNDIAILKLSQSLNFSQVARPACLPSVGAFVDGLPAVVAGWGKTSSTSNSSTVLRIGNVQVLPLDNCVRSYGPLIVTNNMICAGSPPGATGTIVDACPGDSGGPLITFLGGRWYLIGVVSSGPPNGSCGIPDWPGLYTRVSNYIQWIIDNTRTDSTCAVQRDFNSEAQVEVQALAASSALSQDPPATVIPEVRPWLGSVVVSHETQSESVLPSQSLSLPLNSNTPVVQKVPSLPANPPFLSHVPAATSNIKQTVTRTPIFPVQFNHQRPAFLQPSSDVGWNGHRTTMIANGKPNADKLPSFLVNSYQKPSSSPFPVHKSPTPHFSKVSGVPAFGNQLPWKLKNNRYQEIHLS